MHQLSVVIPVYNVENVLERCLESVLNQTYPDLSIILVDDGSTDGSRDICLRYSRRYPSRVCLVQQENGGPSAARNRGIAQSSGEFLSFVDSDDYLEPDMYEKMMRLILDKKLDLAICGYFFGSAQQALIQSLDETTGTVYSDGEIKENILRPILMRKKKYYNSLCNKVYRADIIRHHQLSLPVDRNYGEDWFFNLSVLSYVNAVGYVNEPLYHYVSRQTSIMHQYRGNLIDLQLESRRYLEGKRAEWGINDGACSAAMNEGFCGKVYEAILEEFNPKNSIPFKQKVQRVRRILCLPEVEKAFSQAQNNKRNRLVQKKRWISLIGHGLYYKRVKTWLYARTKGRKA